ncbi:putative vacuolar protein sorting-associated protein [Helianthus anomalus]
MDLALAMDIAYIDHSDALMEEPWLNYQGRWGPKSTYAFFDEVEKITEALPIIVKGWPLKLCNRFSMI